MRETRHEWLLAGQSPSASVALDADRVHVWRVTLHADAPTLQALRATLSAEELERADRFRFRRDMRRYTVTRAALRNVLASYLKCAPRDLSFRYSVQGKPSLSAPETGLQFNVAHSEELAVVALCQSRQIGIDVEYVRYQVDYEPVVRSFFSTEEVEQWLRLPDQRRVDAFFHGWTCKEAFVKATGEGLSKAPGGLIVSMSPDDPALLRHCGDEEKADSWRLWSWSPQPGYRAAACVKGAPSQTEYHALQISRMTG
jgi:4'-phosphopantetheinyl transferase